MRLEPPHPHVGLVVASVIVSALLITRASLPATAAGSLQGDVPGKGASLVVWGGGTPLELSHAAEQRGCQASTLWATTAGRFTVYIYGAPDEVNRLFGERFPAWIMPPSTALVLVCGESVAPPQSPVLAVPSPDRRFADAVFKEINGARTGAGKAALVLDGRLRSAAEKYAALLLARGELSHTLDGQPWDRAQREGYPSQYVGEVLISRGSSDPLGVERVAPQLVEAWMDSPPHRDIILGSEFAFTGLGVGCATGIDARGLNAVVCVGLVGAP